MSNVSIPNQYGELIELETGKGGKMLEKLEVRQKELQNNYQTLNTQVKSFAEKLDESRAQLNKIVGQFEEITRLIDEEKKSEDNGMENKPNDDKSRIITLDQVPAH